MSQEFEQEILRILTARDIAKWESHKVEGSDEDGGNGWLVDNTSRFGSSCVDLSGVV
ncbi:predicted protein [Botrytis cinerea T4]|uniref:Uncharacterized protein n=1 Tax=Botryotinia fuckeliana (strain T4) TaxID=999810 RepID=G2Y982_BOTF4|nr:predicted protein [Botrytis cinerea T4]